MCVRGVYMCVSICGRALKSKYISQALLLLWWWSWGGAGGVGGIVGGCGCGGSCGGARRRGP